jgi:hypothetical protein
MTDAQARAELLATLQELRGELDRVEKIARRDVGEALKRWARARKVASRRTQSLAPTTPP